MPDSNSFTRSQPTTLFEKPCVGILHLEVHWSRGWNCLESEHDLAVIVDVQWLALRLVTLHKRGIEIGVRLDIFPGKDFVIARNDSANGESAKLICSHSLHSTKPQEAWR